MRVTKWGEYGILCCIYLARHADRRAVGAAEISKEKVIPLQYTHQILQRLRKGGIILSSRGPQGGYRLSRPAAQINLKQILMAVEGGTFEVICDVNKSCPRRNSSCKLSPIWRSLQNEVNRFLEGKTLKDIVAKL
jgi:Rrf2 family iron-sulfur cluster assembly transcriptional regulator